MEGLNMDRVRKLIFSLSLTPFFAATALGEDSNVQQKTSAPPSASVTAQASKLSKAQNEAAIKKAFDQADKDLIEDDEALENEFGISFYCPNGLPVNERIQKGKGQLAYATAEYYAPQGWYSSSEVISRKVFIGLTTYDPGVPFNPDELYKKGDLRKTLFNDPGLLAKFEKRALNNARNYRPQVGVGPMDGTQWATVVDRLKNETPARLVQNTPHRRFLRDLAPFLKADNVIVQLKNNHRIEVIVVANGQAQKEIYTGAAEDILFIERDLVAKSISIDRDHLDIRGEWEQRDNQFLPLHQP
jgi:hypothetical protein